MKSKLYFGVLLSAIAILVGCQSDVVDTVKDKTSAKQTIKIHASKSLDTKTAITEDESGFTTAWEVGDQISILEMVNGVSSNSELYEIIDSQGFLASKPLTEGGQTATFEAEFDPYYWAEDDLSTYTFNYSYVAATTPNYMLVPQTDENGDMYIPVYFPNRQTIGKDSFSTECDLLVSNFSGGYTSRPDEIEFHFARLGSIVKITVGGLQEGDVINNGFWYTGDKFLPAFNMEAILFYYPEKGEYKYELPDYLVEMMTAESHCLEFNVDSEKPIVVGADGKADIYLRVLPGEISDWFTLRCNITRGEQEMTFSKYVSLADLGKKLTFKDSGLTKFSVELKEATISNPEDIAYIVPKSRDSFMAAWEAQEGVAKYECYYCKSNYEYGENREMIKVDCFDGATIGMDGMVCALVENLQPDIYILSVLAVPDSEHGPLSTGPYAMEVYVGVAKYLYWNSVIDSNQQQGEMTQISPELWRVTEYGTIYPWYFDVKNVTTNWGWLIGKGEWSFSTSTTMQHPGQISKITITLSNSTTNLPKIYGITSSGETEEISDPEVTVYSDDTWYDYKLEDAGNFNGFKITGDSDMVLYTLQIYHYAPTGEE